MLKDLVLGTATGYNIQFMRRFIDSLKETGFDGEIAFLVDAGNDQLVQDLEAIGAKPIIVQHSLKRFPKWLVRRRFNRGRMKWIHWLFAKLYRVAPTNWVPLRLFLGSIGVFFLHIVGGRFYYHYKYLLKNKEKYQNVFLTDVRDVLFQSNPFEKLNSKKVLFYAEDRTLKIGQEQVNNLWLNKYYDKETVDFLKDKSIICSGTILGPVDGIIRYLSIMLDEIMPLTATGVDGFGLDQTVMNVGYHKGYFDEFCEAVENAMGEVYTLKLSPEDEFSINDKGEVLSPEGKVVPVLHQYDWQPKIEAVVAKKYGPQT